MSLTSKPLWRSITRIAGIWLLFIAACYATLESLFFCCTSFLFPYAARVDLGFGIYPLLQTSKSSTAPEHYTAIFGDSYAFGTGDWFLMEQGKSNALFNTAQLLHQATGQDLIAFGIPGSSNLCGWIEDPTASLHYINVGWRHQLTAPDNILLFFYEGNDILENHIDLTARYLANGHDMTKLADSAYFSHFIDEEMLGKSAIIRKADNADWDEELYFFKLASNISQHVLDRDGSQQQIREAIAALQKNPPKRDKNIARIAGKPHLLPDELGAPPVDMSEADIHNALRFLNSIAAYVRQQYPQATMHIIYIPAPATSYELLSEQLQVYGHADTTFPKQTINEMSNFLCEEVKNIADSNGIGFLDTRASMRRAGAQQELHGIADIGHLNEAGYRVLASAIQPLLTKGSAQHTGCEPIR